MIANEDIQRLTKILGLKFWFGGKAVYPWEHPLNKVKNCMAITLDGCLSYKFKVCKNGKLRCMLIRSDKFLNLGIKVFQTITPDELFDLISICPNNYAGSYLQQTSPFPIKVDVKGWNYLMKMRAKAMNVKAKKRQENTHI